MLQKFMKSSSKSEQAVNTKSVERQKNQFPKKIENVDLCKPVFYKIMNTQKQSIKCNFVAPLTQSNNEFKRNRINNSNSF